LELARDEIDLLREFSCLRHSLEVNRRVCSQAGWVVACGGCDQEKELFLVVDERDAIKKCAFSQDEVFFRVVSDSREKNSFFETVLAACPEDFSVKVNSKGRDGVQGTYILVDVLKYSDLARSGNQLLRAVVNGRYALAACICDVEDALVFVYCNSGDQVSLEDLLF
jgi:hypothetical protein